MTPETLQSLAAVFGWMTLLNIAFYAFSAIRVVALRDWMITLQARLFDMESADIRRIVHAWLGACKLAILVFCLAPWRALRILA